MTSLDDLARQALALMDHLGIDCFNLLGLSVGGMWGHGWRWRRLSACCRWY